MIEVRHLNKFFGNRQVLFDINLKLEPGICNLIIGQSGSGKTVLMKSMAGLLSPDSGEILFDGRNFATGSNSQSLHRTEEEKNSEKTLTAIRREIGMVFQGGALFDSMSVLDNVVFPMDMFTKKQKFLPEEASDETVDGYVKWDFLPNGNRYLKGSTTQLTKKGFAAYLEKIYAFGAQHGVQFGVREEMFA